LEEVLPISVPGNCIQSCKGLKVKVIRANFKEKSFEGGFDPIVSDGETGQCLSEMVNLK
jgi:hypothetical protein